jgi:hypothetical protein
MTLALTILGMIVAAIGALIAARAVMISEDEAEKLSGAY